MTAPSLFDGAEYTPSHDDFRLTGQLARVFDVMADYRWRTLDEVAQAAHAPPASVSAQLRHLRKAKHGGHTVNKRHRGPANVGLYEYQLLVNLEGAA